MQGASLQLSKLDAARLREVRDELRTLRLEGRRAHLDFTSDLRDLLRTTVVTAYGLQRTADDRRAFAFCYTSGGNVERFKKRSLELFERHPRRFGLFDPDRPEPRQRNIVRRWSPAALERLRNAGDVPAIGTYRHLGLGGFAHLRLLACEGPALLSWIGTWQDGPYEDRQLALLASLAPDLQRRLSIERQLDQGGRDALVDATLEAIGSAAFVVTSKGNVRHANAAARALVRREGRAIYDELRAACDERARAPRWSVTATRTSSGGVEHLVTLDAAADGDLEGRVARASARWGLTRRQRDVLAELAAGKSNLSIGALLGISERTVEVHVTALLEKAQVASRAELVARTFMLG